MSEPVEADRPALRVATWNIHGFYGEGRWPDPERTFRLIDEIGADVLALQEVDGRVRFGRLPNAFERVDTALGGHMVEARLFGGPGREYGHLLWSRHPIVERAVHLLPGPGHEPRAAIEAVLATPVGMIRAITTHFGLSAKARRRQAAAITQFVRLDMPTIVLGDFNEWSPTGTVHRILSDALPLHARLPTWPARRPMICFDRIYASSQFGGLDVRVMREAATASDHLPLVADISL